MDANLEDAPIGQPWSADRYRLAVDPTAGVRSTKIIGDVSPSVNGIGTPLLSLRLAACRPMPVRCEGLGLRI